MKRPGKIVCVGRNYAAHAKELGNTVPDKPLLFLKPPSSIIENGDTVVLPNASSRVEYEGEIGVVIGTRLTRTDEAAAVKGISGITCVNDVTARDLQQSDPQWTRAKGFDTFCPWGPKIIPLPPPDQLKQVEVVCRVNGSERQRARVSDMVFSIPYLVSYISHVMTLEPGDLVLTGTPDGVGPLAPGDSVEVEVTGVGILRNPVALQ